MASCCLAAAILLHKATHKLPIKEAFAVAKAMVIIMRNISRGDSVKEIAVESKNIKLRAAIVAMLIVVALTAFGVFLFSILNRDTGWTTVTANNDYADCSDEFVFSYCLGESGMGATAEYKAVEALYSELTKKAYQMFNAKEDFFDTVSLHYIYTHPGEEITIDEALYSALEMLEEKDSRYIYLAPVYDEYYRLFFGYEEAHIAADSDPYIDGEFREYLETVAEYAANPEHISLELLGENRVVLHISEEYALFADENETEVFLDFFRMKNAFIIDYIADEISAAGYTYGNITSFEGYTRNLDNRANEYALNFFDKKGNEVYTAAKLVYNGRLSALFLRSYPIGEEDSWYFYTSPEGRTVTPYISHDGLYRTAANNMLAYSKDVGCSEMIVELMPLFSADVLDYDGLTALTGDKIFTVVCEGTELICTDSEIKLSDIFESEALSYTVKMLK